MSYDVIGSIAILSFNKKLSKKQKKKLAGKILKQKNIETVLEKSERIKGRLRVPKFRLLAGKMQKETIHKENDCKFRLNIEKCYFSPRLAEERKQVAEKIVRELKKQGKSNKTRKQKNARILVMFSGVGPFSIVLGKILKSNNLGADSIEIVSNEIGRECLKYQKQNIKNNNLQNYIEIVSGDAKKLDLKIKEKFDFILMPRPNLKQSFLKTALKLSKKGTRVYYHGFGRREDV